MKIKLFILITIVVTQCLFNSCRKGEEDPFLSLRSRDKRLIGKWELVEEKHDTIKTINHRTIINPEVSINSILFPYKYEYSVVFDGTKWSERKTYNESFYNLVVYEQGGLKDSLLTNKIKNTESNKVYNDFYTIVEINDDNSYIETSGYKNINFHNKNYERKFICNDNNPIYILDTLTMSSSDIKEFSEQKLGRWSWEMKNKSKTGILAGKMNGTLKRLSYNEIIIEFVEENNEELNMPTIASGDGQITAKIFDYSPNSTTNGCNYPKFTNVRSRNIITDIKVTKYQRWTRIKD